VNIQEFKDEALSKFSGCDSDEIGAGSIYAPSVWVLGLEHGTYKSQHDENSSTREAEEDLTYSVKTQLKWPYNRNLFKLLSVIDGEHGVEGYQKFAEAKQPFVQGSSGFFKGNLYPFPCKKSKDWPQRAIDITGFSSKNEYLDWCKRYRLPTIKKWIEEYSPELIVGVGITARDEFSEAVFGEKSKFFEVGFYVNGHKKRVFHNSKDGKILVVVPHLSGSSHGLNSDESISICGKLIRELLENS
jgi:hypothetical protein